MTSLELALQTIVNVLNRLQIPYAVMGGLAVRLYAIPRFTSDVDLTISINRDELPSLFEALQSVRCEIPAPYFSGWLDSVAGLPLFKADLHGSDRIIEIDVFVAETSFQQSVMLRRMEFDTPEGRMTFVSPEDLILLKLIASRPRDLIDVQDILFTMGSLDVKYMEKWAEELSLLEALRSALSQFNQNNGQES